MSDNGDLHAVLCRIWNDEIPIRLNDEPGTVVYVGDDYTVLASAIWPNPRVFVPIAAINRIEEGADR